MAESDLHGKKEKKPFPSIVYSVLSDPYYKDYIAWSQTGDSFIIWKPEDFARSWKKLFKHNNISSFIRQLNLYSFHKVENHLASPAVEFKHEFMKRDRPELLSNITRKKTTPAKKEDHYHQIPPSPSPYSTPYPTTYEDNTKQESNQSIVKLKTETENSLLQDLTKQNHELKGINDFLIEEIIRLRDQQKKTDQNLITIMNQLQKTSEDHKELQQKMDLLITQGPTPDTALLLPLSPQYQDSQALYSEIRDNLIDLGLEDFAKFHLSEKLTHYEDNDDEEDEYSQHSTLSPSNNNISSSGLNVLNYGDEHFTLSNQLQSPSLNPHLLSVYNNPLSPPQSPLHISQYQSFITHDNIPSSPSSTYPLSPPVFAYDYQPTQQNQNQQT